MSEPLRRNGSDGCELPPVTCWPLIYGVAGLVAVGLVVTVGIVFADSLRPRLRVAEPVVAERSVVEDASPTIDRGPDVAPTLPVVEQRGSVVNRRVFREYVPLPAVPERSDVWEEPKIAEARLKVKNRVRLPRSLEPRPLNRDEITLAKMLEKSAVELDLDSPKEARNDLIAASVKHMKERDRDQSPTLPIAKLLASRADLKGLPLLAGTACQPSAAQVKVSSKVSAGVRANALTLVTPAPGARRDDQWREKDEILMLGMLGLTRKEVNDSRHLILPLEQMLQVGAINVRLDLVQALDRLKARDATQAIARRAVFDLSPDVRAAAIDALKQRSSEPAREVFLTALRHPWPPVADHAALALVALEDAEAVPALRKLVDLPDPALPCQDEEGKWRSTRLVRLNHMRNCLLCHPPSMDRDDPMRAPVPTPGQPLTPVYYKGEFSSLTQIRADIVFFRQDFSAVHQVATPNHWPKDQRFDYLMQAVEMKKASAQEALEKAKEAKTYPQREAVRWALARLEKERLKPEE